MPKPKNNNLSIIDLYCGVGGFSLGAARAGFKVVGAIDNDPITIETHKRNFPTTNHLQIDLSNTTGRELLEQLGIEESTVIGVVGGPPCQGFSTIGKNHKNDRRNNLFIQFFRLVNDIKPEFFVCENVPGLLRSKFDKLREDANDILKTEYNLLMPIKIKASDYGVPTLRTRVFFLGIKKTNKTDISESDFVPPKNISKLVVDYALKGLPKNIKSEWQSEEDGWRKIRSGPNCSFGKRLKGIIPKGVGDKKTIERLKKENMVSGCVGTEHTKEVLKRWSQLKSGEMDKVSRTVRLDPNGFCPTLRAGTGKEKGSYQSLRPIHPNEDRVITPREAARLQGFPDWFIFHSTKWHSFRQIGNSVSPVISESIMKLILKKLKP